MTSEHFRNPIDFRDSFPSKVLIRAAGVLSLVLPLLAASPDPALVNRLPDTSHAGYHDADTPFAKSLVTTTIPNTKADGVTDASPAIQRAIDAAKPDAVLLLPKGRYLLGSPLNITKPNLVLTGAGEGGTTLVIPKSLQQLAPGKTVDGGKLSYSFGGAFIQIKGSPAGQKLAEVTSPAKRGDTTLTLSTPVPLKPNDRVRLLMNNAKSLGRHLHADIADAGEATFDHHNFVDFTARVAKIDGRQLTLDRPLRTDVRPAEWAPELWSYAPTVTEVGIEHLTFEFPGVPKKPHLQEEGFNAIHLTGAADCWVDHVTVIDADLGVKLDACRNVTVDHFTAKARNRKDPTGHHALWASGHTQDSLFTHFDIQTRYVHDLSVEGFASGNVFSEGRGVALDLDHHRNAPHDNCFTQLHTDDVSRLWDSSGRGDRGPHSAARTCLWNLTYDKGKLPPLPPAQHWPLLSVIGVKGYPVQHPTDAATSWSDPNLPSPNLYDQQLRIRHSH